MEGMRFHPEDPNDDVVKKLREVERELAQRAADRVEGLGVVQHVGGPQMVKLSEKSAREYQWALKAKAHLFVATVAYKVSDTALDTMSDAPLLLDTENLMTTPALGCFVCEQTYDSRMRYRKCPGEPAA